MMGPIQRKGIYAFTTFQVYFFQNLDKIIFHEEILTKTDSGIKDIKSAHSKPTSWQRYPIALFSAMLSKIMMWVMISCYLPIERVVQMMLNPSERQWII